MTCRTASTGLPSRRVAHLDFARRRTIADADELGTRIGHGICIAVVALVCLCSDSLVEWIAGWLL